MTNHKLSNEPAYSDYKRLSRCIKTGIIASKIFNKKFQKLMVSYLLWNIEDITGDEFAMAVSQIFSVEITKAWNKFEKKRLIKLIQNREKLAHPSSSEVKENNK